MSRLIDADKVIKKLNEMVVDNEWLLNQFNADFIESFIDEQPTAYDVEKVVEQLKKEREYSYANFDDYVTDCSPCLDAEYDDYFHRGLERAIMIVVKAGGKKMSIMNSKERKARNRGINQGYEKALRDIEVYIIDQRNSNPDFDFHLLLAQVEKVRQETEYKLKHKPKAGGKE